MDGVVVGAEGLATVPVDVLARAGLETGASRLFLRRMTHNDVDACVQLIGQAMNDAEGGYAARTFAFHFACARMDVDDGRSYFVLVNADAVRAIIGLHRYEWGPPENVWLAWFAVDPALQGKGVGSALLDLMLRHARALGYRRFLIETYSTPAFAKARAFYQSRGFEQAGGIRDYLPDGGDMMVYARDLTMDV